VELDAGYTNASTMKIIPIKIIDVKKEYEVAMAKLNIKLCFVKNTGFTQVKRNEEIVNRIIPSAASFMVAVSENNPKTSNTNEASKNNPMV